MRFALLAPLALAAAPKVAALPAPVPPAVSLTLTPADAGEAWTLRVENGGDVPLVLQADARLLALEVAPPEGAKGAASARVTCELPGARARGADGDADLVLPPKGAFVAAFDPRLYCFDGHAAGAWVAGATVTGRLGFPAKGHRVAPPYVVTPVAGAEPAPSAAKELVSAPVRLTEDQAPSTPPAGTDGGRLAVALPTRVDGGAGHDVDVPVTVTNTGAAPARLRLRAAALTFDVRGPAGAARCTADPPAPPAPELMTTLRPGASASAHVALGLFCPPGTFDRSGVYLVGVELDASRTTGDGDAHVPDDDVASAPALVRVLGGRGDPPRARPRLAPP